MTLALVLDTFALPETGTVDLHLNRSFEIRVTAEQARRQVKGWLIDQVSYMMTAQSPTLVIGDAVFWRVPIALTAIQIGHAGIVGEVDVNVETGEMNNTVSRKETILVRAQELATALPNYQPAKTVPQEWLAKEFMPTHPARRPTGDPLELIRSAN